MLSNCPVNVSRNDYANTLFTKYLEMFSRGEERGRDREERGEGGYVNACLPLYGNNRFEY